MGGGSGSGSRKVRRCSMSSLKNYFAVIVLVAIASACAGGGYVFAPAAPKPCPKSCPAQHECTPGSGVCHFVGGD